VEELAPVAWLGPEFFHSLLEVFRDELREVSPEVESAVMTIAEPRKREGEAKGREEGAASARIGVVS